MTVARCKVCVFSVRPDLASPNHLRPSMPDPRRVSRPQRTSHSPVFPAQNFLRSSLNPYAFGALRSSAWIVTEVIVAVRTRALSERSRTRLAGGRGLVSLAVALATRANSSPSLPTASPVTDIDTETPGVGNRKLNGSS